MTSSAACAARVGELHALALDLDDVTEAVELLEHVARRGRRHGERLGDLRGGDRTRPRHPTRRADRWPSGSPERRGWAGSPSPLSSPGRRPDAYRGDGRGIGVAPDSGHHTDILRLFLERHNKRVTQSPPWPRPSQSSVQNGLRCSGVSGAGRIGLTRMDLFAGLPERDLTLLDSRLPLVRWPRGRLHARAAQPSRPPLRGARGPPRPLREHGPRPRDHDLAARRRRHLLHPRRRARRERQRPRGLRRLAALRARDRGPHRPLPAPRPQPRRDALRPRGDAPRDRRPGERDARRGPAARPPAPARRRASASRPAPASSCAST